MKWWGVQHVLFWIDLWPFTASSDIKLRNITQSAVFTLKWNYEMRVLRNLVASLCSSNDWFSPKCLFNLLPASYSLFIHLMYHHYTSTHPHHSAPCMKLLDSNFDNMYFNLPLSFQLDLLPSSVSWNSDIAHTKKHNLPPFQYCL